MSWSPGNPLAFAPAHPVLAKDSWEAQPGGGALSLGVGARGGLKLARLASSPA